MIMNEEKPVTRSSGSEEKMGAGSENTTESNVIFFPVVNSTWGARPESLLADLSQLLAIYDQLIALLRETDNDSLDILTDSIVLSVVRCRESLAGGCDDETLLRMVKELRAGLHETPRTLRSLLPGLGARLGESLEHKLGIQFAGY